MERHAAVWSDAVVAHEGVDSPTVKKGRRRPDAFADENSWLYTLGYAGMQARPAALVPQSHDIALREAQPGCIGRIDQHLWSLFP
jgi:hypothetical protein